ncbi:MAG: hypothetical protein ACRD2O_15870, partial [Terriglobia bacterium]
MADDTLYTFPPAPADGLAEWPGSPLGVSNTITRTKGRTAVHDKTVDATPGLLEKLLKSARDHMAVIESQRAPGAVHHRDVVIHGIRVRAITNSDHLHDFWADNWYSPEEWQRLTGTAPAAEPRIMV